MSTITQRRSRRSAGLCRSFTPKLHNQLYGFEPRPRQLYCIVLYLYIYIALLAVHTNQKRFQCERPREKKAVLREQKDALGTPVNKVDRVEGRSWFQSEGPMIAKARV